jgi:hypothetical protein
MEPLPKIKPNRNLKLMDQVRQVLRYHHYAMSTEKNYCQWIFEVYPFLWRPSPSL